MKKMIFVLCCFVLFIGFATADDLYSSLKMGFHAKAAGIVTIYDFEINYLPQMSLGMTIHILPELALRPSVIFLTNNDKYRDIFNSGDEVVTGEDTAIGGGSDILYFFHLENNISLYIGAGYSFVNLHTVNYSSSNGNKSSQRDYTYQNIMAIIGSQYLFNKSFGFFAETGLKTLLYSQHTTNYDTSTGNVTGEYEDNDMYLYFQMPIFGAVFYLN